jgi:hypothetical protein
VLANPVEPSREALADRRFHVFERSPMAPGDGPPAEDDRAGRTNATELARQGRDRIITAERAERRRGVLEC